jgi:hypothetical protein
MHSRWRWTSIRRIRLHGNSAVKPFSGCAGCRRRNLRSSVHSNSIPRLPALRFSWGSSFFRKAIWNEH